ncbi:lipocalin family protein [Algoriphagus sp. AGSA1]|uniref:lipocalin family protein n=1 Tax=Algoriphagus sp. AGSA1 TaxID=2907213 RepID=UPI001F28170C|nr:lipocalin family protein [Algoriphagus sp. AGSA1]MCE7054704.1 lipocalin family protein [Algoriphagus sp. AGSA1]
MKINKILLSIIGMALCCGFALAQSPTIQPEDLIGSWEKEGTLMGDNGTGWLNPHKHASEDCKDHTVFMEGNKAKEVKNNEACEASEREFSWQLEGDSLTLTMGERSIVWHILSIEGDTMKVGVQLRADSEHRMYVVYKKVA